MKVQRGSENMTKLKLGKEEEEKKEDEERNREAIAFIQCMYLQGTETIDWWKNVGRPKSKHSRSKQRLGSCYRDKATIDATPCQIDLSMHD
jgi:hypothetical protein